MTKPGSRAEVNSFVQGLITEASPLNFPANATRDEENFELNIDGTRDRRLGMDFETGYQLVETGEPSIGISIDNINTFKWYSVAGIPNKEFFVSQVNKKIFFFDLSGVVLSDDGYKGTVELGTFPTDARFSFTSLEGKLIVTAGVQDIAVVEYLPDTDTFGLTYQRIQVRDQWGVQNADSVLENDISFRPTTLSDSHRYNLRNQSWGIPRKNETGVLSDPVTLYFNAISKYPSNSELVWAGLQYQPVALNQTPFERVYPNLYDEVLGADIKAPKGHFIIDLLERGSSRQIQYNDNNLKYLALDQTTITLPTDRTPGGAKYVADFAGRAWFGGFGGTVQDGDKRSPILSNYIAFSQLIRSPTDITKCHQDGDPSSRDNSDLIDTDGGLIRISEAQNILAMKSMGTNLVVIALNGVWAIAGGDNNGFSATNYRVQKISAFGGLSSSSVVEEGGRLMYWSEDGIYVITYSQLGDLTVESMTQNTIQTYYGGISLDSKFSAIGAYDRFNKTVRWTYKNPYVFTNVSETKELIFDTRLNAFYPSRIMKAPQNDVEVIGGFPSASTIVSSLTDSVFVESEPVYAGTEEVISDISIRSAGKGSLMYLVMVNVNEEVYLTFSHYKDPNFIDWFSHDGVGTDAKAYMLTGSQTAGDSSVMKQIPYLVMHFRRTEKTFTDYELNNQSSCLVRSQWDWADHPNSGKWSELFQGYRYKRPLFINGTQGNYDYGFETIVTKNKIRGRGRAFSFYMETEPLKDCRILGWSLTVNGNQQP